MEGFMRPDALRTRVLQRAEEVAVSNGPVPSHHFNARADVRNIGLETPSRSVKSRRNPPGGEIAILTDSARAPRRSP